MTFADNLGYLIVCIPKQKKERKQDVTITVEDNTDSIVAVIVDCGEASATVRLIELIQQYHYKKRPLQVHAILSTHKHHDHTGGNSEIMSHSIGSQITKVYGGAVERVPQCTHPLVNGDKIELPKSGLNDMNELLEIEAVAVPAHTRGSLVYRLSSQVPGQPEVNYMFTGDTMFSAGAGVPFEADTGTVTESQLNRSHGNTFFRAGKGQYAMERCFAEILCRGMPDHGVSESITDSILIFPGHEYTSELLSRQFQGTINEACRWKNFVPRDFFETVSHMYVALHRRSLPHNSGKILLIPSTLKKEIKISPHFRSLRRSGELVVRAVTFWYQNICKEKQDVAIVLNPSGEEEETIPAPAEKTPSTARRWTINAKEVGQDIFTTLYTADLDSLIADLVAGEVTIEEAASRLRGVSGRLEQPVVNRRAIPGFLPSNKSIYRGISGFVLLGSRPSAMTLTDSRTMKLPPPIDSNSDRTMISMQRLLLVLGRLGLLQSSDFDISIMIKQLWKEAGEFLSSTKGSENGYGDAESPSSDEIELGVLKWVIYGVPSNQPSWFSKVCCMPCSDVPAEREFPEHPSSKMKQKVGDLVSHDVLTCLLCRTSTGCLQGKKEKEDDKKETESKTDRAGVPTRETQSFSSFSDYLGDNVGVEMMESLSGLLKEHE
jgi:glyoxylase-like metal-dependent hydrolase (beta-lactamase superfamily II)